MTRNLLTFLCFITLLSCVDHEISPDPMEIACKRCGKSEAEMQWLQPIIESAQSKNGGLGGEMYAVPFEGRTIIVHQPMIMSCVACNLYDCEGNRVESRTIDMEKFLKGMNRSNRIYTPFPD